MTAVPAITDYVFALRSSDQTAKSAGGEQTSQRLWTCARSVFSERTKTGAALVVFTLAGSFDWTLYPGYTTVIGPDHKDSGGQVQLLAPGTYTAVHQTDLTIIAALVPPSGAAATPQLIGDYEGVTTETGT